MNATARALLFTSVAALAAALVPTQASGATDATVSTPAGCAVRALGPLDGMTSSQVTAADRTGRWVAGTVTSGDGDWLPVIWHGGDAAYLVTPVSYRDILIADIGPSGDLVANGNVSGGPAAFARIGGRFIALSAPGFVDVTVTGLDERGHAVGWARPDAGSTTQTSLQWDLASPDDPAVLDVPYVLNQGLIVSTNARGDIVVSPNSPNTTASSYLIKPNGRQHVLAGVDSSHGYHVTDLSRRWAGGTTEFGSGTAYQAVRWELTGDYAAQSLSDVYLLTGAVNNTGVIGGLDYVAGGSYLSDGATTTLLPGLDGATSTTVTAMAARRDVVVGDSWDGERRTAVQWRHCG